MECPLTLRALDRRHITIKKPGSEFYNYKSFFSLVLLAVVDTDYRFVWVDVGSSGYSSDAQTFNHSKFKKKDQGWHLMASATITPGGGPYLYYFLLNDDTFALIPWHVKPYNRKQLTREERIAEAGR